MFLVALGFGTASFVTFLLGLLGWLQPRWLWVPLAIFFGSLAAQGWFDRFRIRAFAHQVKRRRLAVITGLLLGVTALIYSLRLLVPETAFDALWYHLTLPKLYLEAGRVRFFPGGLLYYSAMPQAMEMLYLLGLAFGGQMPARGFHFLFGVASAVATYQLARRFVALPWALVATLIFYAQLVVGWESSAAYVDLTRTFLETTALIAFLNWQKRQTGKWLVLTGSLLGLSVGVKLLSLGTVLVILALILWQSKKRLKDALVFAGFLILVAGPWFVYSRWQAGSWFYPFFDPSFQKTLTLGSGMGGWLASRTPPALLKAVWGWVFTESDILSPVFLISLPLLVIPGSYRKPTLRILAVYVTGYFLIWFLTPMNDNRFWLSATPALATLLVAAVVKQGSRIRAIFLGAVFAVTLLNLGATVLLNRRVLVYLISGSNQQAYLNRYLVPELGNFGAAGRFLQENVGPGERVLVIGGHNLFYLPVPFDHESWAQRGVKYDYLLVWQSQVPEEYAGKPLIFGDKNKQISLYDLR